MGLQRDVLPRTDEIRRGKYNDRNKIESVGGAIGVYSLERTGPLRMGSHVQHDGGKQTPRGSGVAGLFDPCVPFLNELRTRGVQRHWEEGKRISADLSHRRHVRCICRGLDGSMSVWTQHEDGVAQL